MPRKNRQIFAKKEQSHSEQANGFVCLRHSGTHCDACEQFATQVLFIGRLEQSLETLYSFSDLVRMKKIFITDTVRKIVLSMELSILTFFRL